MLLQYYLYQLSPLLLIRNLMIPQRYFPRYFVRIIKRYLRRIMKESFGQFGLRSTPQHNQSKHKFLRKLFVNFIPVQKSQQRNSIFANNNSNSVISFLIQLNFYPVMNGVFV